VPFVRDRAIGERLASRAHLSEQRQRWPESLRALTLVRRPGRDQRENEQADDARDNRELHEPSPAPSFRDDGAGRETMTNVGSDALETIARAYLRVGTGECLQPASQLGIAAQTTLDTRRHVSRELLQQVSFQRDVRDGAAIVNVH